MPNLKEKPASKTPATTPKGSRPDLDKLQEKVLAKDKYEKAVQSLKGAKFPDRAQ